MVTKKRTKAKTTSPKAAFASGTIVSIFGLFVPDGPWKTVVILSAPGVTLLVNSFLGVLQIEINVWLTRWTIDRRSKAVIATSQKAIADPNSTEETRQKGLDAINNAHCKMIEGSTDALNRAANAIAPTAGLANNKNERKLPQQE